MTPATPNMPRMIPYVLTFLVAVCSAPPLRAQISGTDHDLSNRGFTNELCVACHTPHNADISVTNAPLWNHELTAQTFQIYSSATLDATLGQPDGISKLCLGCHDGSVALDSFGGATGTNFMDPTDHAFIGTDLRNDHPISFTYDAALATTDGELHDPVTQTSGLGGTIDEDMLFAGQLECGSCHDVHDNTIDPFLRKSNAGSSLCLTCHNK